MGGVIKEDGKEGENVGEEESDLRHGKLREKVEPFPTSDFIEMVPFINLASFLHILYELKITTLFHFKIKKDTDKPKPEPPYS